MRNLVDVVDNMLSLIPQTELDFVADLKSIRSSAAYASPELMFLHWRRGAETMSDYISQDENEWTDWQKQVVAIWMDENNS